jgi:hypothetical protein
VLCWQMAWASGTLVLWLRADLHASSLHALRKNSTGQVSLPGQQERPCAANTCTCDAVLCCAVLCCAVLCCAGKPSRRWHPSTSCSQRESLASPPVRSPSSCAPHPWCRCAVLRDGCQLHACAWQRSRFLRCVMPTPEVAEARMRAVPSASSMHRAQHHMRTCAGRLHPQPNILPALLLSELGQGGGQVAG